jgi:beta-lactamase regulating signal transducer with metallopeptidase domain
MVIIFEPLVQIGSVAVEYFWFPVLLWTVVATLLYLIQKKFGHRLEANVRYLMNTALLAALPAGLILSPFIEQVQFSIPIDSPSSVNSVERSVQQITESTPIVEFRDATVAAGGGVSRGYGPVNLPARPFAFWTLVFVGLGTLVAGAISIIKLARLGLNIQQLRRHALTCNKVVSGSIRGHLARARQQVGVRRNVILLSGLNNKAPMTYGVYQPVIILPEYMTNTAADSDETWLSLLHELTHIRRRDYAVSISARTIQAMAAWHPLVTTLKEDIDLHREMACDQEVLNDHKTESTRYARALMRVSEMFCVQPALSMSSPRPILFQRIKSMNEAMKTKSVKASRSTVWSLVGLFLLLPGLLTACVDFTDTEDDHFVEAPVVDVSGEFTFGAVEKSQEEYLIKLETEYAYLEGQYDEVGAMLDAMKDKMGGNQVFERDSEWTKLARRKQLLESMMSERAYGLEEVRMDVMVGKVLESRR